MSVLAQLEQKSGFTKTERELADMILADPQGCALMSLSELSEKSAVSHTVIIRMCRKMGLDGYKGLRAALKTEGQYGGSSSRTGGLTAPFSDTKGTGMMMRWVANVTTSAIQDCYMLLSEDKILKAAGILKKAEKFLICSGGESYSASLVFEERMRREGYPVVLGSFTALRENGIEEVREHGAVMVVAPEEEETEGLKDVIRSLRKRKIPVIVMSGTRKYAEADLFLQLPDRPSLWEKARYYYSLVSVRYILGCIYGVITRMMPDYSER